MENESPLHNEASLLPGYLSKTLSPEEQQQVSEHLQSCSSCQEELQEVKIMQAAFKTVIEDRPGPSPNAFNILMSRIEQEKHAPATTEQEPPSSSWIGSIQDALQSLYEIQWVPTLATVLIVGQSVLLFSIMGGPNQSAGPGNSPIIERGIPQGKPHKPSLRVQVAFQDMAPEQEIRQLIQQLNGKIIDGPTPKGLYTLTIPKTASLTMDSLLNSLKNQQTLIRSAQPHHP